MAAGQRHLSERLVRPIVIKVIAEAVKPHLLLGRRGGRRSRGLRLESGVRENDTEREARKLTELGPAIEAAFARKRAIPSLSNGGSRHIRRMAPRSR
jgi:hypothetical protein